MDLITQTGEICAAALLGALTVVGIMVVYLALCAVCKQITRVLHDDVDHMLPR